MNPRQRMGVGLIGDSPAGVVVARSLAGAGHALIGRTLPPEDRAEQVDVALSGVAVMDIPEIVRRSEMVILASHGDALEAVVERLADEGLCQSGQLVLHLAIDHSLEVLSPLVAQGVIPLWLYPMLALTGSSLDSAVLRDGWCAVSAPTPVLPIAQALAIEMGLEPFVLDISKHGIFSHVVQSLSAESMGFVTSAIDQLESAGVEQAGAALGALTRSAMESVLRARAREVDLHSDVGALFEDGESDD
jgi:predicted short-subunit dehydrogenase-like oxidoreductase (DUF2520 family)